MAQSPAGKPRKTPKPAASPKKAAGSSASTLKDDIARAAANGFRYYVYALADAQGVFYIGKGTRNRVFHHEQLMGSDSNGAKKARIAAAGQVTKTILAFFNDEASAYAFERGLIAEGRSGLTNMAGGSTTQAEASAAQARSILERMAAFDDWAPRLSTEKVAFCISMAGSVRAFYDKLKASIQAEATNPTPRSIFVPHIHMELNHHGR